MMERATSLPFLGPSPATSSSYFGSIRIIGIGSPITPVEQTPTSRCLSSRSLEVSLAMFFASCMPVGPVQALAFPLFVIMALKLSARRWLWETRTGAAFTRF